MRLCLTGFPCIPDAGIFILLDYTNGCQRGQYRPPCWRFFLLEGRQSGMWLGVGWGGRGRFLGAQVMYWVIVDQVYYMTFPKDTLAKNFKKKNKNWGGRHGTKPNVCPETG